jgi:hypothetical protein
MANAPLAGQDGGSSTSDFPISPAIYFNVNELTYIWRDLPVGQDSLWCIYGAARLS